MRVGCEKSLYYLAVISFKALSLFSDYTGVVLFNGINGQDSEKVRLILSVL